LKGVLRLRGLVSGGKEMGELDDMDEVRWKGAGWG
jgi:hypothetical protein